VAGRVGIASILVAAIAGAVLSPYSVADGVGFAGFWLLAVAWFTCALASYRTIRRGDVAAHRRWAIRTFARTNAAVTHRHWLGVMIGVQAGIMGVDGDLAFDRAYHRPFWRGSRHSPVIIDRTTSAVGARHDKSERGDGGYPRCAHCRGPLMPAVAHFSISPAATPPVPTKPSIRSASAAATSTVGVPHRPADAIGEAVSEHRRFMRDRIRSVPRHGAQHVRSGARVADEVDGMVGRRAPYHTRCSC
jgi:hypothetical protein